MPLLTELRATAKELGIKGYSKLKKADIIQLIEKEQNKPPPPAPKSHIPTEGKTRVASFDIGKKNFAFCIEEFDKESLLSLDSDFKLYNEDGTPTERFSTVLNQVCNNGEVILCVNEDLTMNCAKGSYLDRETFYNMNDLLDKYVSYFDHCEAILVEEQMNYGKAKRNPMAVKLGQHCQSYFMIRYGHLKPIIEFPAYHKTQVLGAKKLETKNKKDKVVYKAMEKPARKKWSVQKASEILKARGEDYFLNNITTMTKKDDICDCLLQGIAYRCLKYVNKTI